MTVQDKTQPAIRPILYTGPMIRAQQEGKKTQTRRLLKTNVDLLQPAFSFEGVSRLGDPTNGYNTCAAFRWNGNPPHSEVHLVKCPYQVGDFLWVRESFLDAEDYACSDYDPEDPESGDRYSYRADCPADQQGGFQWKPGIHMPKAACRLFQEITQIRVERLHDISEADALAEGIDTCLCTDGKGKDFIRYRDYESRWAFDHPNHRFMHLPTSSYASLWKKINGRDSWRANPYVWVYDFKLVEKPANFLLTA